MKKEIIIILLIFSICVTSCDTSKTTNNKDIESIHIDIRKVKESITFNTVVDSVRIIKLDTIEDAIISAPKKILNSNDRLFVLDKKQKSILQFDLKGKFIHKLSKEGRGPGEYVSACDINFNKDSTGFYVLDNRLQNILEYTLDNQFVSSKSYKELSYGAVHYFEMLSDNIVVFYSMSENRRVVIYNTETKEIMDQSQARLELNTPFNHMKSPFFRINDKLCYFEMYDQNIYEITMNGIVPLYQVDFGKLDFIDITELPKRNSTRANMDIILNKDWVGRIFNMNYSKDHLMFYFFYKKETYRVLYNVVKREVLLFKSIDDGYVFPKITNCSNSKAYSIFFPFDRRMEKLNKEWFNNCDREILNQIDEFDNVYILQICLRK